MKWNKDFKRAPKNKPILLDIGEGFAVVGQWNEGYEGWIYAMPYDNSDWFKNEYTRAPIAWAKLPKCEKQTEI